MGIFVYLTENIEKQARRFNQWERIQKLQKRIMNNQNLQGFESFEHSQYLKKRIGDFRIIAYCVGIKQTEDKIIFLCSIYHRSENDYNVIVQKIKNGDQRPYIEEQKIEEIYRRLREETYSEELININDKERELLDNVFETNSGVYEDDITILETQELISKLDKEYLRDYYNILNDFEKKLLANEIVYERVARLISEEQIFSVSYYYDPVKKYLLIISPINQSRNETVEEGPIQYNSNNIMRFARRYYPLLMIADYEIWKEIVKDEQANLALSEEENEILTTIRNINSRDRFPLFINGRAGSGKSTMLQYLFADFIEFIFNKDIEYLPLYLTYNNYLLKIAKQNVNKILKSHYKKLLNNNFSEEQQNKINYLLDLTFKEFHNLLFDLLPIEIQEKLRDGNYVNYTTFLNLWKEDFSRRREARKISPELAWHVIRTYIKGMRSSMDDEFTPDEYNELPRRNRTVTEEKYNLIFEKVWNSWYKGLCRDMKYWDDQDLAAYILENEIASRQNYSAIFCDESQDFTRSELEIIYQLSIFSRRKLEKDNLSKVPYIFAGDPLQTINPTGFRWESLKSDFHNRFSLILEKSFDTKVRINYKELKFNYRSNSGIVKFCNLIQFLRCLILNDTSIEPQESWFTDIPIRIIYFYPEEIAEELKRRTDFIKLINCEVNEEYEYVRNDEILSTISEKYEEVTKNVMSPMRAKGLEFPYVVLYKFGESAPADFYRLINNELDSCKEENKLALEYFLNRLYVAASRAKKILIIVEKKDIIEKFWKFAIDPEYFINQKINSDNKFEKWKNKIEFIFHAQDNKLDEEPINARQMAESYKENGLNNKDPYLLRQAALSYSSANINEEAQKCYALAYEYENNFIKAAELYENLQDYESAIKCYWKASDWPSILKLHNNGQASIDPLKLEITKYHSNIGNLDRFFELFEEILNNYQRLEEIKNDKVWRRELKELAKVLYNKMNINDSGYDTTAIYNVFNTVSLKCTKIDGKYLAFFAYKDNKLNEAIKYWEACNETNHKEYYLAQAQINSYPNNIEWYSRAAQTDERYYNNILNLYQSNKTSNVSAIGINEDVAEKIINAAIKKDFFDIAIDLLNKFPHKDLIYELINKIIGIQDKSYFERLNNNLLRMLDIKQLSYFIQKCNFDITIMKKFSNVYLYHLVKNEKWKELILVVMTDIEDIQSVANEMKIISILSSEEYITSSTNQETLNVQYLIKMHDVLLNNIRNNLVRLIYNEVKGLSNTRISSFLTDAINFSDRVNKNYLINRIVIPVIIRFLINKNDWSSVFEIAEHLRFSSFYISDNDKLALNRLIDQRNLVLYIVNRIIKYNFDKDYEEKDKNEAKEVANFILRINKTYDFDKSLLEKAIENTKQQELIEKFKAEIKNIKEENKNNIVTAIRETTYLRDGSEIYILDLKIRWSKKHYKIKIENNELETITYDLNSNKITGDINAKLLNQEENRWLIEKWNVEINFNIGKRQYLIIKKDNSKIKIELDNNLI